MLKSKIIMFKRFLLLILFLVPLKHLAQDFSNEWKGYFSYNEITKVIKSETKIYASSNNAIFSLDLQFNEIKEFNTINGLSGETISTIHYSEGYELLIIGYTSGLIEIVFDNGNEVLTIVDITEKTTIQPNKKKINNFIEYENSIYISTNFGISIFDLEKLEFGDTYFIGNNGTQVQVNQTAIFNNNIYAACSEGGGIKKASITNPNLIDFQNWETLFIGDYLFIETYLNDLYTIRSDRRLYTLINDLLNEQFQYTEIPKDLKSSNQNLVVTTQNNVYIYNSDLSLASQIPIEDQFETQYTSAITNSDDIYIGTKDFGILKTNTLSPIDFEEIHPDGPLLNTPFSIQFAGNNLWVVYGGYDIFYNWSGGLRNSGISNFNQTAWNNIPFESIESVINDPLFLSHIAINPSNSSNVFISSYYSGLMEINETDIVGLNNQTNSTITPFVNDFHLTLTSKFDNEGNLWVTNGRVDRPLNKLSNNNWKSFDFTSIIGDRFTNLGFSNIEIHSNNNIFIGTHGFGLIGFNENNEDQLIKNISGEEKNMPSNNVYAIALDKRNQIWIGTGRGLRVLFNTSNFFEDDDIRVEEIIIEEDGVAKELLFQQFITDITVDGSNNKWIGTADSGLFYFSSDGQNTIFHFTKDNSPLPSNTINDVSIDESNGVVYIATSRGLVSFLSGSSSPFEDLTNAFAYPNPVRPNFNLIADKVKIKDISENVNIKITDIEGNLVAEAQSRVNLRHSGYNLEIDGGTAYWNGKNLANNIVASGVYLIMLSDLDTFETSVIKLMVVR